MTEPRGLSLTAAAGSGAGAALVFNVPLPPRELSPNMARNVHWAMKNKSVADYKEHCFVNASEAARRAGWVTPHLARVSLEWHLDDRRHPIEKSSNRIYKPRDPDNAIAASKAMFDALTESGVIVDDTWDHIEIGRISSTHENGPYVVVTVEPVVGMARMI